MEANHLKLLAIDDNQDNLTTLKAVVREVLPDCTLLTALNGTRGIELARSEDPDVILLDIVMLGMDGFEVCRRLKTDERLRSIPVVFLTALRTDRESRVQALEAGAEAFLSKPLDDQELIALVRGMARLKAANRRQWLEKEQLAALVVERTRQLERELAEHKRSAMIQEAVYRISQATQAAGPLGDLYRDIHQILDGLMPADNFFIALSDPDGHSVSFPYVVDRFDGIGAFPARRRCRGLTEQVLSTGRALHAPAEVVREMADRGEIDLIGTQHVDWLGVPLKIGERIVGVMAVQSYAEDVRFGESDLDVLLFVSTQVAVAIERKRAEEQLTASHRQVRDILESISDAFLSLDDDLVVTYFNAAAERMLHRAASEVLGRPLFDAFPEARGSVFEQKYRQALREKQALAFEADFSVSPYANWYDVRVYPQTHGISAYFQVITDRKQAEAALRESEERFNTLVCSVNEGVWSGSVDGRDFLYANPAFERLYGRSFTEFRENPGLWNQVAHPDDRALVEASRRRLLEQGSDALEYRIVRPDGEVRWVFDRKTLVRDRSGKVVRIGGIISDTTERKRAEENLQAANTQLAQAVARAETLSVRAESANRAKSEFLANMSHEIRTPMTAILGYSELLSTGEPSPVERREFVQAIHSSGEGLLGIINDILDLSRIEADRLILEKTECSLRQIVEEVVAVAKGAAAKKGLSLQVAYSLPVPVTIHTDAARLRQILVNLVGNAVKFTERGEVRLTVCCCESAEGTARMQFVVSDTGIGIPSAKLDEIFQPFVQVARGDGRRYAGTGLGLSICQRLAQALNGRIEATSELGRGSTFTLTVDGGPWQESLGRAVSPDQVAGATARAEQEEELNPVLQGRILFVEDEPTVQMVVRHLLRKLNLELELADDGQLGCQMAEQSRSEGRPYALILMDIQLPRMDGLEATRWLRSHGWSGPIVALTAYAMTGDRERCLAAGCDDYLSKPISPSGLREVLRRYLGSVAVRARTIRAGESADSIELFRCCQKEAPRRA